MDSSVKTCANVSCGVSGRGEWKNGWPLRSGDFASLCFTCGSAYENAVYCETYHAKETGWRECSMCHKLLHCGCISSESYIHLLDYGGVDCSSCVRISKLKIKASNEEKLEGLCKLMESGENQTEGSGSLGKFGEEVGLCLSNSIPRESKFPSLEKLRSVLGITEMHGSPAPPSLNVSISAPYFNVPAEKKVDQQESKQRAQPLKSVSPDPFKCSPEPRIARPPAEGRGKNQLLPRYWPRITDQELQQLSGDLNSKIVPLFEKVLSASDAGRIGRLVLPKACAEAYFPPISQSEGVPIRIQDIKGIEWTFQFRFWPNNNSRMYVLEGVTPCIQSMQLRAGDTITFSRIDPGGRLVLGYRKASNNPESQEEQPDTFTADVDPTWSKNDAATERKKMKNIGPKNKRLLINNEDALELRMTWDEAQDLLRPPPNVAPTTVTIDDHDFEEYDEPPVFGKRTVFTSHASGVQEQWAQCDTCSKWRKLPVEVLLQAQWTCAENVWDPEKNACAAEEEGNPVNADTVSAFNDVKKRKARESRKETEACGLDALASAAVMGEGGRDAAVGVTTKHPRHRAGCTCIVCIQPPSGKGKHKPTCTCNVCMTVKRRFKTLMLRKKKRMSEREGGEKRNDAVLEGNRCGSPREIDLNYCPLKEEESLVRGDVNGAGSCSTVKLLSDQEAFFASIGWERGTK